MAFDPISIVSKLHACMGDTCYCKPGNEHRYVWTEADKQRLKDALRGMVAREKRMAGSDSKGG